MKTKIISLLTAIIMVVGLVGVVPTVSARAETFGDFEYETYTWSEEITITKYIGKDTSVTIPSEIDGKAVTKIGSSAFADCYTISNVTIPCSVISIEWWAFRNCERLKNITIPDSVTNIGPAAFSNCSRLESISIPYSVVEIGDLAFGSCEALTNINVDENNEYYSSIDGVLYDNAKTKLIKCPETKTNLVIPDSVTSIGDSAFYLCKNLKSVTIPDGVTIIGDSAFYWCENLTSVTIPHGVTRVGEEAFEVCKSLTSITIPSSIISIGEWAFFGCFNLTDVYYVGTQQEWNNIVINNQNDSLLNATIHYTDSKEPTEIPTEEPTEEPTETPTEAPTEEPTEPTDLIGDLSGDGKITTVDVGIVNSFAKGTRNYTNEQLKIADANGDGKITTVDVGMINRIAKGTNNQPSVPDNPPIQNGSYLFIGSYTSLTNTNIDGNVYVGYDGIATLENSTINGDVYVYGQLSLTNCVINGTLYGYNAYGGMFSCGAYDGIHGNINLYGGNYVNSLYIMDDALDYAFETYGIK